jgi:hypothetical protein
MILEQSVEWQGKQKYSEKVCLSATLSTTNPTSLNLGSNPGRRVVKPVTNRLRYGPSDGLLFFFFTSFSGGVESNWVHSARLPLIGLLCLPRVIMMMENLEERRLAGETEVLGENPPPGSNPGHRGGKPETNRLNYGPSDGLLSA